MKKLVTIFAVFAVMLLLLTGCNSNKSNYEDAMSLYEEGVYQEAGDAFDALGDYEDSAEMVQVCRYAQAGELYDAGDYDGAIAIYQTIIDYEDSTTQISACHYAQAGELYDAGDYDGAIAIYETIPDYEDSATQISACRYAQAEELYKAGDFDGAIAIYETITDYADSTTQISACYYAQAEELYKAGDYEGAIAIYETISEYKDSSSKIASANQKIMYATYGNVIDLLTEETWFYNGGSDTILKGISFTQEAATIQQVHFDGNGLQNDGSNEYDYVLDDEIITVTLSDTDEMTIPYSVSKDAVSLGDGDYFTMDDVIDGLQGNWMYTDKSLFGLKSETNLQIDGNSYKLEEANEGIGLSSGDYYYSGPYSGTYTVGFGSLDFGSNDGNCLFWSFNIINGVVTPLHWDRVCSRGSGLKGLNGYKF